MAQELERYVEFVDKITSKESKDFEKYIERLKYLKSIGCDIERLDTAATGLNSESGEVIEIVKKIKFQGKDWNDDAKIHLLKEAGDVIFYWIELCIALGLDPNSVIAENVSKLESRYPGGKFSVWHSENRKNNDL